MMLRFSRLLDIFLTSYFTTYLSWPDWLYFYCFFRFEYFDPYDHYAACWVTISVMTSLSSVAFVERVDSPILEVPCPTNGLKNTHQMPAV